MTLAIDFGTCNTVLACWQPNTRTVKTLRIGAPTRIYNYHLPEDKTSHKSAVIPSIIHYDNNQIITIGAQVENLGLNNNKGTFRWMKPDLLKNNNRARRIDGKLITPRQAAFDFLQETLHLAAKYGEKELVVTLPIEAFDHYVDWLRATCLSCFHGKVRMLDEATACILGYGAKVRDGQVYVIFDFGGGTLDVSVVKTFDIDAEQYRPCTVLGRAGEEIGGTLIDEWLLHELQRTKDVNEQDLEVIGIDLLHAIEDAKIKLSSGLDQVEVIQYNDLTNKHIKHTITAIELRNVLNTERANLGNHSLYQLVAATIERALKQAQERYGTRKSDVQGVFMVGGSSLLLGIAELIKNLFPNCIIHRDNPFEAIARGACRYAGGDINLSLVHDYCLRSWDAEQAAFNLVPIIPKGTRYPTETPVSVKYVNGACEGATSLGLIIIERSDMVRPEGVWEVVGGRLQRRKLDWNEDNALRELNPEDREFIHVDPPCTSGTRRFIASFGVDVDKRLTVSLRDLNVNSHSYVQLNDGAKLDLPVVDLPFVKL